MRTVQRAPVTGVVLLVALLTLVQATVGLGVGGWTVGVLAAATAAGLLAVALHRAGTTRFGPANVVTLVRVTLGQAVAALVAASFVGVDHRGLLLGLTALALALDAIDGHVARRTGSVTPLGARFDMEADAFLILVLSVAAVPVVGWWVLAIGFARYALLLAERVWRWLRVPVPPRYWRKVVAAVQGVTLAVVVTGVLSTVEAVALLLVALGLLAESFGRDVAWLARRQAVRTRGPVAPTPSVAVPAAVQLARTSGG
ncbi:MAG TPA: CDP-alcohol phosphatidyltransferase family protein [Lapillicoccus sp.]